MLQCEATTTKGTRCQREAADGGRLCRMHQRVAQDVAVAVAPHTGPVPQVERLVQNVLPDGLRITAEDDQPPAVRTVFWALEQPADWQADPDAVTRDLAVLLHGFGGTQTDLEALIGQAVLEDWARGYWRALTRG